MASRDEPTRGVLSRWLDPSAGAGFATLAICALAIALSFVVAALWRQYGSTVVHEHRISAATIEITPPPAWIRTDVRQEAIVSGSLSGLSIREEDLTLRVAEAFRVHSWVAKVKRVSKKHPDRVVVQLEYREPVAMVEVRDGLYPIDIHGVLLPTADFSAEAARKYPRVAAADATPMSPPGAPWGDERIHDGAIIAAALGPYWEQLGLYRILAFDGITDARGRRGIVFRLSTRKRTMIIWGHAPGKESPAEPPAEKKIARLLEVAKTQGSLDSIGPGEAIDLRDAEKIEIAALPDEFADK